LNELKLIYVLPSSGNSKVHRGKARRGRKKEKKQQKRGKKGEERRKKAEEVGPLYVIKLSYSTLEFSATRRKKNNKREGGEKRER